MAYDLEGLTAGAGQKEKRKRFVQHAKKIGITLKRRFLPLKRNQQTVEK
jgi:hypothetical protein